MCEPMLLALERRYDLANLALAPPADLLPALRRLVHVHGFRQARPRSFGRELEGEDFRRVRTALHDRSAVVAAGPAWER